MKIQLKRSNVLEGGVAKAPTAGQMEYGELAVNYNTGDPVIFIKDSDDAIIRLTDINQSVSWDDITDKPTIGDGEININAAADSGITITGDNATANQETNSERLLSIDTVWLNDYITSSGNTLYLSKVGDDTAAGHITFSNKITVGTFDMESLNPLPA